MIKATLEGRIAAGIVEGSEAQWTLGRPLVSAMWGYNFLGNYPAVEDLRFHRRQTYNFNCALGSVTGPESALGAGTIAESYVMLKTGRKNERGQDIYVFRENPYPLNWSKANLALALALMEKSVARIEENRKSKLRPWDVVGYDGPMGGG